MSTVLHRNLMNEEDQDSNKLLTEPFGLNPRFEETHVSEEAQVKEVHV